MQGIQSDIRDTVISNMVQEYTSIFGLGTTEVHKVLANLTVMNDAGLAREILLLQYYHSDTQAIYMRGLTRVLEFASNEEKINSNPNLILNF